MNPPSMFIFKTSSLLWKPRPSSWTVRACAWQQNPKVQQGAAFSSSPYLQKRKKGQETVDPRIKQIRYFLQHPLTPRPLRLSRTRSLRHWTIHRAWQLYQSKLRQTRQLELERQYNSMAAACEALRLIDNQGFTLEERAQVGETGEGKERGKLFRIAMRKDGGLWNGVPIEYARIQTDTPPKEGWNHSWTR